MLSINSIRYYQENHKMMKIIENNRILSFGVSVINSTEFKSQVCHVNCVNFVKPPNLTIGCLIYTKRMIIIFNSQSCFVRFKLQNEYEALNTGSGKEYVLNTLSTRVPLGNMWLKMFRRLWETIRDRVGLSPSQ